MAEGGRYYDVGIQDAVSKEWRTIRKLPSVTTVLGYASKDGLPAWAAKLTREGIAQLLQEGKIKPGVGAPTIQKHLKEAGLRYDDVRDAAGDRGTLAHDFVEELMAFGVDELDIDAIEDPWKRGLAKWWKDYQPSVIKSEEAVTSLEIGTAGRIDLLAFINDLASYSERRILALVDFKTVTDKSYFTRYPDAYDSNRVQLVVYDECLKEEYPTLVIDQLAVVRLAEGEYHHYAVPEVTWPAALEYFKGCLAIHNYRELTK